MTNLMDFTIIHGLLKLAGQSNKMSELRLEIKLFQEKKQLLVKKYDGEFPQNILKIS